MDLSAHKNALAEMLATADTITPVQPDEARGMTGNASKWDVIAGAIVDTVADLFLNFIEERDAERGRVAAAQIPTEDDAP